MTQLTVRGIDGELHKALKQQASESGLSVNKYVVEMLRQVTGLKKKPSEKREYNDLDWLAGTWSKEEAEEFDKILEEHRKIDWEMWE